MHIVSLHGSKSRTSPLSNLQRKWPTIWKGVQAEGTCVQNGGREEQVAIARNPVREVWANNDQQRTPTSHWIPRENGFIWHSCGSLPGYWGLKANAMHQHTGIGLNSNTPSPKWESDGGKLASYLCSLVEDCQFFRWQKAGWPKNWLRSRNMNHIVETSEHPGGGGYYSNSWSKPGGGPPFWVLSRGLSKRNFITPPSNIKLGFIFGRHSWPQGCGGWSYAFTLFFSVVFFCRFVLLHADFGTKNNSLFACCFC